MIKVKKHGFILNASKKELEIKGVLNPRIYQDGDNLHLTHRAIHLESLSSNGHKETKDSIKAIQRTQNNVIKPNFDYEKKGRLDAQIVKIDDTYYITYPAHDGINTLGALATSKDLIKLQKHGIITPQLNHKEYKDCVTNPKNSKLNPKYLFYYNLFSEIGALAEVPRILNDRDFVLFPRKINGRFAMLHCLWPGIQVVYFDDFTDLTKDFWKEYFRNLIDYIVLDPQNTFEANHLRMCIPPIETEQGWLLIYYGIRETNAGKRYSAKAALVNSDKPEIEIARLNYPLFHPSQEWKKKEDADQIIFPTGHAIFEDTLYMYYDAADHNIAVTKLSIKKLLTELLKNI
jgi:predicted GH43/DUF377 family glycosyl hydrolase